ncbi:MAG TPA: hypothetical protein VH088_08175 [Terriglobales bacterium]|nr:hypothetical protein [Terriglobales bacterium]
MNAEQWQQVKDAFQAALDLPAEQRSVYLDGFCAAEPGLREEIESLLRHYHAAGTLLENPPHFSTTLPPDDGPDPWLGQKIGPYQAISKIGEGGMGAVYRAVRVDDHCDEEVPGSTGRRSRSMKSCPRLTLKTIGRANIWFITTCGLETLSRKLEKHLPRRLRLKDVC